MIHPVFGLFFFNGVVLLLLVLVPFVAASTGIQRINLLRADKAEEHARPSNRGRCP
jgi:hypothetical protein